MSESYSYPLLTKMTEAFPSFSDVQKIYVCASQHILEPQGVMFDLLVTWGIPRENIVILGKIYSTSPEIFGELKSKGFSIDQPGFNLQQPFDIQHKENCEKLFTHTISRIPHGSTLVVLDDGADLLLVFNARFREINSSIRVIGIEQTSSGFRKLEKETLTFPVINVARSPIKLDKESPLIARLGCDRIKDVITKYNLTQPKILVVGLGPMGKNVLMILEEEGYKVVGHDTAFTSQAEILSLIEQHSINMIVGSTGSSILTEEQIRSLNNIVTESLYLISMSSSDREFPSSFLRQNEDPHSPTHSNAKWNSIILVNNGFPITFKGNRYESTPLEIEKTIALLYGSTLYVLTHDSLTAGILDVPEEVNRVILESK